MRLHLAFVFSLMFIACRAPQRKPLSICLEDSRGLTTSNVSINDVESLRRNDGKRIAIEGVFAYAMEDVALYGNIKDLNAKGLWLQFDKTLYQYDSILNQLAGKKVILEGRVNTSHKGHLDSYELTISDITCIKELR
jgi:hypothetical protein